MTDKEKKSILCDIELLRRRITRKMESGRKAGYKFLRKMNERLIDLELQIRTRAEQGGVKENGT